MKEISGVIRYKDKEYRLAYNLNAMERIQDEYGTLDEWGHKLFDAEPNVKAIIFGFEVMLNEAIMIDNEDNGTNEPLLTTRQVGRLLTELGLQEAADTMLDTINRSTESAEKN